MEIRLAETEDAALLTQLRLQMRRERETVLPPEDMAAFQQNNLDYFIENLANGSYIGVVAEEYGEVIATGGICLHNHPPSYSVPNGKSACLLNMYTLPGHRGRGAAGKILAFLVQIAAQKRCCQVFLNASDMGKSLYEKFGFREVRNEMVFDLDRKEC